MKCPQSQQSVGIGVFSYLEAAAHHLRGGPWAPPPAQLSPPQHGWGSVGAAGVDAPGWDVGRWQTQPRTQQENSSEPKCGSFVYNEYNEYNEQGKKIRTPGCAEINQSDKTEPKPRRTPCSSWVVPFLGNIRSPWITAEFPCSVKNTMDLAGMVPVHFLPQPLLFWGTELDRKDNLVLVWFLLYYSPRIPLTWDWTCCTGAAKPLLPRHWMHPPPSCYSLPLALISQNINFPFF